ncbi:MAG TPA: tRNA (adenosine(37)-N6)-threonylcarbamoyltransferase complex ATPase subunit type 1 TsaE [Candidatus Magasanikbacteria bacterium]|nr:tRNA (adenosine(37)-N6)-threonylcarbamoyltransferase complex ATPase subunit type 1 TsaE [Candidatus Magasanikbacteria bacterium]
MEQYTTKTEKETIELGRTFAAGLRGGDVVLLRGNLGAGKTVFVKGVAAGLGVREDITSPTFMLMNLYALPASASATGTASKLLCHIDTYRLKSTEELRTIGVQDYIGQPCVITLIEWPEKAAGLLSVLLCVEVEFKVIDGDIRMVTIEWDKRPYQ